MLTRWFLYLVWCHCCTMFYSRPAERPPLHLFWSLSSPARQTAMFAVTPRSHCDHIDNGLRSVPPEGLNSQAPCQECSNVGENWICLCCYEVCSYICVRTHLGLQYGCTHAAGLSVHTVVHPYIQGAACTLSGCILWRAVFCSHVTLYVCLCQWFGHTVNSLV